MFYVVFVIHEYVSIVIIVLTFLCVIQSMLSQGLPCFMFYLLYRSMFPQGLPSQFSIVSTLRMRKTARAEVWDLFKIDDAGHRPQFGIRIDGPKRRVLLYMLDHNSQIQTLQFKKTDAMRHVSNSITSSCLFP